jgi:uncharacterized protein DUF2849
MSKTAEISVLTANRLGDGIVVFLDFEGAWSENIAEALAARSPDEVRQLQDRGAHDAAHNLVVEPYLMEVREAGGSLIPIRYRERVRVSGPTILDDVPGYVEPGSAPSPHRSSRWGEGRGEGQTLAPTSVAAPHPNPLPVKNGEREPRERLVEAA